MFVDTGQVELELRVKGPVFPLDGEPPSVNSRIQIYTSSRTVSNSSGSGGIPAVILTSGVKLLRTCDVANPELADRSFPHLICSGTY